MGVERIADGLWVWQQRSWKRAELDSHDDAIGFAQAFESRDFFGGRQAQAEQFFVGGQGDVALQPLRTWGKALEAQHFAEAGKAGQWLLKARRDERARALAAAYQALFEQDFKRLASGDAGDIQGFTEATFRGQRLLGLPVTCVNRRFQVARQL
jgi:hypothetical protein